MKKLILASALLSLFSVAHNASAANHSLTLGYAQSKLENIENIKGVNVKYRFEFDHPVSVITSFSYMSGDYKDSFSYGWGHHTETVEMKSYSLSVGPAYRFNDYISIYGMVGVGVNKIEDDIRWDNTFGDSHYYNSSETSAAPAYSVGLQINPTENFVIDAAYEMTKAKFEGESYSVKGFNVGVGYRF